MTSWHRWKLGDVSLQRWRIKISYFENILWLFDQKIWFPVDCFFHFQLHRCRHLQLKYLRISNYFSGDPTRFDNEYLAWQTVGNENWISVFAYQSNDIRHELKQDIIKASYEVKNYTKTTMDEIKKLLVDIFPVDEFIEAQEKTKHKMIDVII